MCGTVVLILAVLNGLPICRGQDDASNKPEKHSPAKILPAVVIIAEQVVQDQWPNMLRLVNAPTDLQQLEPGQCVYFGVFATGEQRDGLLAGSRFSFQVSFLNKTQRFDAAAPGVVKQIKPEGGDFVTAVLGVGGIHNPFSSLASLALSKPRWCVAAEEQNGTATIRGVATTDKGQQLSLTVRSIDVKTMESARSHAAFNNEDGFSAWVQHYHDAPDPAQLLPGLRMVASQESLRSLPNIGMFFVTALKAFPPAADELLSKLPAEGRAVRVYAIPLLSEAGYRTDPLLDGLTDEEKTAVRATHLPDPFDRTPDRGLPSRQDMLWAVFFATGDVKPVRAVAGMLAWREDSASLEKMRQSGQKPAALTDSIMRAVAYRAAGWSLLSLDRQDGLVADYIDFLKSDQDTPALVKDELANLATNPSFTHE